MNTCDFKKELERHNLQLTRAETTALQVNVGLACDLACRHCHLEAGPARTEMMDEETVSAVIQCARRLPFNTIDITGGAPELLPFLPHMIESLAPLAPHLIVRTNLVSLARPESKLLPELYRHHKVIISASLPATNASQTESQRGSGVWATSLSMLKELNRIGYGVEGSGLQLDLISNPAGAFLPAGQAQTERRYRQDLQRRHGIVFTNLYTFANVPLGRFRAWLEQSGNLDSYLKKLSGSFNSCTVAGLMCRSQISVDWNGFLYDCDFNLAAGLNHGDRRIHISELKQLPACGTAVPVGDHCYACTAGSGFT